MAQRRWAIAAAHEYDDNVRTHFGTAIATSNQDPHSTRDWAPAAAIIGLTWAGATLFDSRDGYEEGKAMVEAAAFTAITTEVLKFGAGRRRPYETTRVDDWRDSGSSFPSSHASLTFAIGTVPAESGNEDCRWVRRVIGYGAASAVAYSPAYTTARIGCQTPRPAPRSASRPAAFVTHRADRAQRAVRIRCATDAARGDADLHVHLSLRIIELHRYEARSAAPASW